MNLRIRKFAGTNYKKRLPDTMVARNINPFVRMGMVIGRKIGVAVRSKNMYVEIICALLIILFIYTGLNKIMDYEKFKFEMGRSPFIQNMSGFIAATLPAGELLIALTLIIKRTRLLSLYLSFLIMALFTGYIWLMLNYAHDLPCSCGGVLAKMSWKDHLYFNAIFTALSMAGIFLQSKIDSSSFVQKQFSI